MPREAPRPLHLTTNITSERMTPIDPVSQKHLAALITYLYDKTCALCRVIYHSFYEADEDIPLDERIPEAIGPESADPPSPLLRE
jgi:hypothetical protein